MIDINDKEIENGSIIDLHQTVNGENRFVILSIEPLDVRYGYDLNYKYQYNLDELFKPCPISGTVEYEIIGNIYNLIDTCEYLI